MRRRDSQRPGDVGKVRPSQVVGHHGPGAVIDLPDLSVIIAGIDAWAVTPSDRIHEPRLERFLGDRSLCRPPRPDEDRGGGLPAYVFPEWLVCPRCRLLAPYTEFHFDHGEYTCNRTDRHGSVRPAAFPARFMIACEKGHLDDFPWRDWAHGERTSCRGPLELLDDGRSGSASDLRVVCRACGKSSRLGKAFDQMAHSACRGHRPWFGPDDFDPVECTARPKTILRGASNAYFPVLASALSVPPFSDPIYRDLGPHRDALLQAQSLDQLRQGIELGFYRPGRLLEKYTVEQVWRALQGDTESESELRHKEYAAFLNPAAPIEPGSDFELERRPVPLQCEDLVEDVVAATRLREVRALRGFTRLDSAVDLGERTDIAELQVELAPIGSNTVTWLPAIELRGEGIFVRLREDVLTSWETLPEVVAESRKFEARYAEWRSDRGRTRGDFSGMRYVLLHSLAHVLIRHLSLDCGYSASALRERIYCSPPPVAMAGILIYTASTDSDGSLGGLVDQSHPSNLGPLLADGLHEALLCTADPLCGAGQATMAANLCGAACHACLFLPETSCECGNRFLDRAVLVETTGLRGIAVRGGR